MNLFLLRHGKAAARGVKYPDDSKRPLTSEGEKDMRAVADGIVKLDLAFDLIMTSPYARAARTAEILAERCKSKKLFPTKRLAAEAEPREIVAEILENFSNLENICLVGHEPYLSDLISVLLIGQPGVKIELKKAGLCKLGIENLRYGNCGTLHWLLTPRQLSRIGKR